MSILSIELTHNYSYESKRDCTYERLACVSNVPSKNYLKCTEDPKLLRSCQSHRLYLISLIRYKLVYISVYSLYVYCLATPK